jgi:hypothetical protein
VCAQMPSPKRSMAARNIAKLVGNIRYVWARPCYSQHRRAMAHCSGLVSTQAGAFNGHPDRFRFSKLN